MKLKQISVPIENSHERVHEITRALGEKGINLRALNLVDTGNFGELRVLVSDVTAARRLLMEKQIPARVEDVVAVVLEDKPGQLSLLLRHLMDARVEVKYGYAMAGVGSGKAIMVFRFDDNPKAVKVLETNHFPLLDAEGFGMMEAAN